MMEERDDSKKHFSLEKLIDDSSSKKKRKKKEKLEKKKQKDEENFEVLYNLITTCLTITWILILRGHVLAPKCLFSYSSIVNNLLITQFHI